MASKRKKCGFGKIYDSKSGRCRKMSSDERLEVEIGKTKGFVAGGAIGRKISHPVGTAAGALVGRYVGGKRAKKKLRK